MVSWIGLGGCVVERNQCVPGASASCACSDGARGAQICDIDGIYGACECRDCAPGVVQRCVCEDGTPGAQTCMEGGQFGMCKCMRPLDAVRAGVVGTWEGMVTTPWTSPYSVHIEIYADGHYSGYCLDTECTAFYYGTDADSPEKEFIVNDILADGSGSGYIIIVFDPGGTNTGELRDIWVDADQLSFEFWHRGEYGPLAYDLMRIVSP